MKDGFIKVAAASVPLRVADCGYNAQQCAAAVSQAKRLGVRILALPELCLTGYTCHDLFGQEALRQGTLFPGLDLPFHKELRSRFPQVDGPLLELMALDFAIDELGLYLTTHADDQQALELYWSYIRLGQEGRKRYQEKCGPLMQTDITPGSYQWLNDPWPWDGKGN